MAEAGGRSNNMGAYKMDKKTEGVEIFVREVLAMLPKPYGEDIILKVFQEILKDPELIRQYRSLSIDVGDGYSDDVINKWIGKYVSSETGMKSLRQVPANGQCSLITSYSELGW